MLSCGILSSVWSWWGKNSMPQLDSSLRVKTRVWVFPSTPETNPRAYWSSGNVHLSLYGRREGLQWRKFWMQSRNHPIIPSSISRKWHSAAVEDGARYIWMVSTLSSGVENPSLKITCQMEIHSRCTNEHLLGLSISSLIREITLIWKSFELPMATARICVKELPPCVWYPTLFLFHYITNNCFFS